MQLEIMLLNKRIRDLNKQVEELQVLFSLLKRYLVEQNEGEISCSEAIKQISSVIVGGKLIHDNGIDGQWIGKWTSRDKTDISIEKEVIIDGQVFLFGYIQLKYNQQMASVWTKNGDHLGSQNYDLIERIREGRGL